MPRYLSNSRLGWNSVAFVELLPNELLHRLRVWITGIEGIRRVEITMPKGRNRVSLTTNFVDDSVKCTLIHTSCPSLDQVTQIYDKFVFECGELDPLMCSRVPDFQAILARLLEEDGQATIVGMLARNNLSLVCKGVRWIFEKLEKPDEVDILISPYPENNSSGPFGAFHGQSGLQGNVLRERV